jgi:GntR family transcriptional regulator, transcriptional repressor for pyruvate dehydrogenase complex
MSVKMDQLVLKSAKTKKASEHIIGQIRNAIFEGQLHPGDRLPPEKELMESFKVSKATLREALRSLEMLGFLEIRKGASGGPFVTEVDLRKARDCFSNFLHFKNLSLENLSEVLLILEPHIAEKATLNITAEELDRLKKLNNECDSLLKNNMPVELQRNKIEFHRIIGTAAGNPILIFILDFVINLLTDTKDILQPDKEVSRKDIDAHRRIYEALLNRDGKKAREEMIGHLQEMERDLAEIRKKGVREINFKCKETIER